MESKSVDLQESPTRLALPRVGQINFSNCLPINLPIEKGKVALEANLIDGTPQELNQMIESGELEVSSSSSFLYLSRNDLELIDDLSISSYGPVGSVLFFSKCKLDQLHGKRMLVPKASATSIRLAALMLKLGHGADVEIVVVDHPQIDDTNCDAALVIGDEALRIDEEWSEKTDRVDLGEWWTERFKLPMVFGVFVARKQFVEHFAAKYRHIGESLRQARLLGTTSMLDQVIERAHQMTGLSKSRMQQYFEENLNYRLGEQHIESLQLFRRMLSETKLL